MMRKTKDRLCEYNILPRLKHHNFFLFALFALILLMAQNAQALNVNEVRFGIHQDKTRMVLELSAVTKFRAFVLDDPYRLVIDLPAYSWNVNKISKPATSGVTAIRQGNLQPGVSRIVVDLSQPMLIKSAFILRAQKGLPDRLVIDFAKTSRANFTQERDRIHGILDVSTPAPTPKTTATAPPPQPKQPEPATTPSSSAGKPLVRHSSSTGIIIPGHKPQPPAMATAAAIPTYEKPLIIIDPGHGGVDPGAIGSNGIFEKHIVLSAAQELQRALVATGRYRAELTRHRDNYLKLYQRVDIARKQKADLFISLHADTIGKSNVRGASIYTLSENASDKQTESLAARENKVDLIAGIDLSTEDEEVANILVDLTMRDTMNQSKFFANTLVGQMKLSGIRTLEKPHRYAGFAVLKAPDIPSVLIELGFLSNKTEANLLSQPGHRMKIIQALIKGIDGYFEKVRINQKT